MKKDNIEIAIVSLNSQKYNFLQIVNGNPTKLLFNEWFVQCHNFIGDFSMVKRAFDNKWNFVDKKGKYLSSIWFDRCDFFEGEYARVFIQGKCNWLKTDGSLLSPNQWFTACNVFYNGYSVVVIENKSFNLVDTNGNLAWSINEGEEYESMCHYSSNGLIKVSKRINGLRKYNYIDINRKPLLKEWVDGCWDEFVDGKSKISIWLDTYDIDINGNILGRDE